VSRWNIEKVRDVYAAFGRGEFPSDEFEPDAEWHTDPLLPRPMAFYGREEVASYFERFIGAWQALHAEPVNFEATPGEQVIATVRMGPPSASAAADLEASVAHLWTLRHGRVARVRVFGMAEAAREAAAEVGPPPPAGPTPSDRRWEAMREYRGPAPEPQATFVRELAPAASALDLGCGDGRLSVALRAGALTAADVSLVALKRARRRLPGATIVLLEPGKRLPFEAEAFELVLCADTIQEVQDVAQLVADVKRVLKPGGMLALTTPAHGRRTGLAVLRRGFGPVFDPRRPQLRFLTARSLEDLLDLAGFHSIAIERKDAQLLATARR
jgi:SAM-dependent methyltransferase/ketosteroid isomerase-like protein